MDIGNYVPYIFFAVLFIVLVIFVTRAVFSIPAMLRYFKAIVELLALQAEKNGVEKEKIVRVLKKADEKDN